MKQKRKLRRKPKNYFESYKLNKPPIHTGEKINESLLKSYLDPYIQGIINCLNLLTNAIEMHPTLELEQVEDSNKVVQLLLMKSVNDLRSLWLLSKKGYSIQAADLAGSLYESFIQINYIANNNELAREWIEHSNPKRLPDNVYNYTKAVFDKIAPEHPELTNTFYSVYSELCKAKHGNPLLLKNHFYKIEGDTLIADYGPELSRESIKLTCYSICWSIRFMIISINSFINSHLAKYDLSFEELKSQHDSVYEYYEYIYKLYSETWSNT